MRSAGGRWGNDGGASAVEFAIVLPLLILLLGGIIDFGFAFNAQIGLSHAAREGVRFEAIDPAGEDGAARAVDAYVPLMTTGVGASVTQNCPGDVAAVEIRATYDFIFLPFGGRELSSEAVMRCGG